MAQNKALVVWNLLDAFVQTGSTPLNSNQFYPWDASKFATLDKVYLQATGGPNNQAGCIPNSTSTMVVELYNNTDSVVIATIYSTVYPETVISADILSSMPNAAAGEKLISVRAYIACGTQVTLIDAKLLIVVRAPDDGSAIKARHILNCGYSHSGGANALTEVENKRMIFDAAKFGTGSGGINQILFGCTAANTFSGAGFSTDVELYDNTAAAQIDMISLITSTTQAYYKNDTSLGDLQGYLTSGNELCTRIRGNRGNKDNAAILRNAHLIVDTDDTQLFETHWLFGQDYNVNVSLYTTNSFTTANRAFSTYRDYAVDVTKTFYGEACANKSVAGDTGSIRLYDRTASAAVTNTQCDFTATAFARVRNGSAVTEPTNGNKIDQDGKGYTSSASNLLVYAYRLIMEVSNFQRYTPPASRRIFMG